MNRHTDFSHYYGFLRVQLWRVGAVVLAVFTSFSVSADGDHDKRSDHRQNSFPLSIIEGGENKDRPSLERPLSYRSTLATVDQIDPLKKTATVNFGSEVRSVGEAAQIVLEPIGYEMVTTGKNVSPILDKFLQSPLPDNLRELKHLHVYEMLRALAGVGYVPVFDHVQRRATFDPLPRYIKLGYGNEAAMSSDSGYRTILSSAFADEKQGEPWKEEEIVSNSSDAEPSSVSEWKEVTSNESVVVSPVGQESVVTISGVRSTTVNFREDVPPPDVWKSVSSVGEEAARFSEQVADVISARNYRSAIAIIRTDVKNELLAPSTEVELRRVAKGFDPQKNRVALSNCSGNIDIKTQRKHASLIISAMSRLGIDPEVEWDGDCSAAVNTEPPNGETQFMVALIEATPGVK